MARKKEKQREKLLTHPIRTRLTEVAYQRLKEILRRSNCRSVGEVARKILCQEKILLLHRDVSLSGPMEELASIRKELKSIGINVNQLTRKHNGSPLESQRGFYARKVSEDFGKIEMKVDRLLSIVSELAEKWLQK